MYRNVVPTRSVNAPWPYGCVTVSAGVWARNWPRSRLDTDVPRGIWHTGHIRGRRGGLSGSSCSITGISWPQASSHVGGSGIVGGLELLVGAGRAQKAFLPREARVELENGLCHNLAELRREDCGTRSSLLVGLLVAFVAMATAGSAAADHIGQPLDCGTAGTFTIIGTENAAGFFVPKGETNLFRLDGTTSVYVIKEVRVDGQLRWANPGFQTNGREVVTCTFIGPRTGRIYTNTGILT